ncbi:MAG: hypothetical protein R3E60_00835 [Alphaproteobacteria bacterium]
MSLFSLHNPISSSHVQISTVWPSVICIRVPETIALMAIFFTCLGAGYSACNTGGSGRTAKEQVAQVASDTLLEATICAGTGYPFGGAPLTESGTYVEVLPVLMVLTPPSRWS